MSDETLLIDLEGALLSGKTTACLWKVRISCEQHPGIAWFIFRFADGATQTKLRPAWEAVCAQAGERPRWDAKELCYDFTNGSRVYAFGLKAQDQAARYTKLRGLGVSGIYGDQGEELPRDLFLELIPRMRQAGYPHQFILSPNPMGENEWLAQEFPAQGTDPMRRSYALSLYDNARNLPAETITAMEAAYPPSHAKHRTMILGLRGLNVIGEPVYKGAFDRALHVRALAYDARRILLESFDFGQHHPCVLWAQQPYSGGLSLLGGLLGQDLFLDEFLPMVEQYRADWFPTISGLQTCCDPAGSHQNSQGTRFNGVSILRQAGIHPVWKDNSNAPDVREAMIELLASHMRHRGTGGQDFGIEADPLRWLRVSKDGPMGWSFLADGCEAGYVWDPHMVSVGSKRVRRPKKDGWYEHGQNCMEYLELNFGAGQKTAEARAKRKDGDPGWRRNSGGGGPMDWAS